MKIVTSIFALVIAFQAYIANPTSEKTEKKSITVIVPNVSSNKGTVNFALYNKKTFMQKPLQALVSKVSDKRSKVVFTNVEPGEYAVICFHDANSNKTMDFQENGMPLEDYGVSNNAMNYGPPQYDDAKFVVTDKDVTLEIVF